MINRAVEIVRKGGVIVYPTDSGYALGCKIEDKGAMERICRIRQLPDGHNFTLMCRDLSELSTYAFVDNVAFRLMKNNTPGNYTFILKGTKEVPRRLLQEKRKTIGMRVPSNPIAQALLETLGEPMLSTSLMLPGSDFTESDPEEIKIVWRKWWTSSFTAVSLGSSRPRLSISLKTPRWCCAKASAT